MNGFPVFPHLRASRLAAIAFLGAMALAEPAAAQLPLPGASIFTLVDQRDPDWRPDQGQDQGLVPEMDSDTDPRRGPGPGAGPGAGPGLGPDQGPGFGPGCEHGQGPGPGRGPGRCMGRGPYHCLRGGEMREAVRAGEAKPLGPVMREIGGGEIVRTMLCRTPHGLVYLIAVLNGSRVEKMIVDAETGRILHWH